MTTLKDVARKWEEFLFMQIMVYLDLIQVTFQDLEVSHSPKWITVLEEKLAGDNNCERTS